jgi:hypothetical protein
MVPSGKERDDAFCEGVAFYKNANRAVLFPWYPVAAHCRLGRHPWKSLQ